MAHSSVIGESTATLGQHVANRREYSWDEIAKYFPVGGNCNWCGKHMCANHTKCFEARRRRDERVQRNKKET